jgi:RNA polymerase sigma factor (sigma-70 family)
VAQSIPTDERLVEQASSGDRRALEAIFKRYHRDLFRYCAALLGNTEDAADALQNTMVKVLGALPGERRRVHLKAWLYRIAHNESIELLRKRRDIDSIDPDALVSAHGPEVSTEARERLRQLLADLRELPERQRGALVMRELGGLGFEQIGAAFETSAAVARQTVYEARLGLQEMERGRAMECDEVRRKLSDGDRRVLRRRDVRAHLRQCSICHDFEAAMSSRRADLAAISPIPALAAAGLLKGVLGGAAGSAGGAAAGAGAAGGAISASAAVKTVATVAVAGAIGVGAADRAGVVQVFHGAGGGDVKAAARGERTPPGSATARRRGRGTEVGQVSVRPGNRVEVPSQSREKGIDAQPLGPDGAPGADARPRGRGSSSAGSAGRGHEKAAGKGAGSANAHGRNPNAKAGNPNAMGGNPNAKGGNRKGPEAGHEPSPPQSQGSIDKTALPPQAEQGPGKAGEPPGGATEPPGHGKPEG